MSILRTTTLILLATLTQAAAQTQTDKRVALDWARSNLTDPYSLRSTGISPVFEVGGSRIFCIRYNAKNQYGGYTGLDDMAFVYTAGGVVPASRFTANVTNTACVGASYRSFPELEKLR